MPLLQMLAALEVDHANAVAGHVQRVQFVVCQSERRWACKVIRGRWRQTANPSAVQIKNEHGVHVYARRIKPALSVHR